MSTDHQAFARLYDHTSAGVYGMALRVLQDPAQAAEVTQEVYLEAWMQSARFDASRGSIRNWLFTLAHRRAVDRVRSQAAASSRDQVWAARSVASHYDEVSATCADQLDAAKLRNAVRALSELQRESIYLAYFGGNTQVQIAAALAIPLGTVKTRLRDALRNLRTSLAESV